MSRKLFPYCAAGALCLISATAFGAPVVLNNQGFEAGNLAGWTPTGDVTAQTTATVGTVEPYPNGTTWTVAPFHGGWMAQLVSQDVPIGTLNNFFWNALPSALVSSASNGAGIQQSYSGGKAGEVLTQYWNFFFTDSATDLSGTDGDTAFAVVKAPGSAPTYYLLANMTTVDLSSPSSGWKAFTYPLPSDGDYEFGFGVVNLKDGYIDAQLFLDSGGLPEPTSLALLGIGLAAVGWRRRRA